jgi:hypothetical protein
MKEKLIEIIGIEQERAELMADEILSLFDEFSKNNSICRLNKSFSVCYLHRSSKFGCKYCKHNKNEKPKESEDYYLNNLLEIEKEVLKGTDLTHNDIRTPKRDMLSADTRSIIYGLFSRLYPNTLTLEVLGRFYNRNHATVIYSIGKFNRLYEVDKEFTQRVNNLNLIKIN